MFPASQFPQCLASSCARIHLIEQHEAAQCHVLTMDVWTTPCPLSAHITRRRHFFSCHAQSPETAISNENSSVALPPCKCLQLVSVTVLAVVKILHAVAIKAPANTALTATLTEEAVAVADDAVFSRARRTHALPVDGLSASFFISYWGAVSLICDLDLDAVFCPQTRRRRGEGAGYGGYGLYIEPRLSSRDLPASGRQ